MENQETKKLKAIDDVDEKVINNGVDDKAIKLIKDMSDFRKIEDELDGDRTL